MSLFAVVLSTYNGEKYLQKQLDSIVNQQDVALSLFIRDDGSSDGTVALLQKYVENHENISVKYGKNIGVIDSFFEILQSLPEQTEYIALADQDDIWQPDKLQRAQQHLSAQAEPALYCSCYTAIDAQEHPLWQSQPPPGPASLNNAIVQNIATGCTTVFNRTLLGLLEIERVNSHSIIMHDWWLYLTASCFGKVIYDSYPAVQYRQHGDNVVGVQNGLNFWKARLNRCLFQRRKYSRIKQATEFLRIFENRLSHKNRMLLQDFINRSDSSFLQRLSYIIHNQVQMQSSLDTSILKLQILAGLVK